MPQAIERRPALLGALAYGEALDPMVFVGAGIVAGPDVLDLWLPALREERVGYGAKTVRRGDASPVAAFLMAVVSAVGVGLSGLVRRPLFSVVVTYLVVALLTDRHGGGVPGVADRVGAGVKVDVDVHRGGEPLGPVLTQQVVVGRGQELRGLQRAEQAPERPGQQQRARAGASVAGGRSRARSRRRGICGGCARAWR